MKTDIKLQIKTLREAGKGYGAIATQLGMKRGTVAKHCQKMAELALLPPPVKVYKGKIQGREPLRIKNYINANPKATLDAIIEDCNLTCSKGALCQYLKRNNLGIKIAKSRIVLSNINRQKRIDFCRLMLQKTDSELNSIWFSDETIVKSRPNGEVVFYRASPGQEYFEPSNGPSGKSVMFWGVISMAAYGPLVVVQGANTAETYIETLKEYLLPEIAVSTTPVIFQQDNAAIHKTAAVLSFLAENNIETLEWPPQSPDLSPIENIWNVMKMKMKALRPRPRTHANMRDACLQIWSELDDDIRRNLLNGFKGRLEKCLAANGQIIKF
jgi:DDE superfamily endonuclease/Transposase